MTTWGAQALSLRDHLDLEPLRGELLDRAVVDRAVASIVEQLLQLGIGLAQADRDADAEALAAHPGADDLHVLELGLFHRRGERGMGREDAVDAAGREVEVVLLGGLVLADLDDALEVLLEERGVRRRSLDADGLTLEHRRPGIDDELRVPREVP